MKMKILKVTIPEQSEYKNFIDQIDYSDTFKMIVVNQNLLIGK